MALQSVMHEHRRRALVRIAAVMPDHVHIVLTPLESGFGSWWSLSTLLQGIKGTSAHRINAHMRPRGHVWQKEFFDRIIRNESEFRATIAYI